MALRVEEEGVCSSSSDESTESIESEVLWEAAVVEDSSGDEELVLVPVLTPGSKKAGSVSVR